MLNPCGLPAGDIANIHCNHAGPGRPAYEYDVRPWSWSEPELDNMRQLTLNCYGKNLYIIRSPFSSFQSLQRISAGS